MTRQDNQKTQAANSNLARKGGSKIGALLRQMTRPTPPPLGVDAGDLTTAVQFQKARSESRRR